MYFGDLESKVKVTGKVKPANSETTGVILFVFWNDPMSNLGGQAGVCRLGLSC